MPEHWIEAVLWLVAATHSLTVLAWWVSWIYQYRLKIERIRLKPVSEWAADRPAPSLAVVIACHNEEAGIESCVRMLLAQRYPNMQVVIANDRSTDRTGEIVRRLAAEDSRIKIIDIHELPPGWTGKTHAVHRGVRGSESDYVLFMDSDVELAPHAILTVMDKVVRDDLDFFSFWPYLDLRTPSERFLTPPAMLLLSMWAKPFKSGEAIAKETIMGNGQFMLVKRTSYEAIGGHESVGAELAEDAVLAYKAHEMGQRCWSGPGDGLYLAYREGDFKRTVNSLARVLVGSLQTHRRLWLGTQVLLGGGFAPVWVIPTALICLAMGLNKPLCLTFLALGVLQWLGIVLSLRHAYKMSLVNRWCVIWFPIGSAIIVGVLVWSSYLLAGLGTIKWGSTRYRLSGTRILAVTNP